MLGNSEDEVEVPVPTQPELEELKESQELEELISPYLVP